MAFRHVVVPIALTVALAGCGSFGAIGLPWKRNTATIEDQQLPPPPGAPAPVESSSLPAPGTDANGQPLPPADAGALDPTLQPLAPPAGTTTALNAPTDAGVAGTVARTDLLGGWTITSGTDSCQLFMTLTSWTGGFRASTRGCNSALLKGVSAWNLNGTSVVLAGQGGAPLATLTSSGNNRFDGTANGQPITFYR
ncbi:MAG TPA: AprI/Inh family metalloprotease inhibitor [Bauldia sp.]|nr:AprI/Inh family metalloprotease inhibitor [Bauldia sp.]